MKSFFLMAIMTILSLNTFAQDRADPSRQNLTSNNGMIYSFDMNDNTVIGTPYIENEFMPGEIHFDNQTKIYNLRYDAFNDVIEVKKDNGDLDTLNKDLTDITLTFIKGKKSYRAHNYLDPKTNNSMKGYFVVASKGAKPLLVKEKIVFTEKQKAKSSYHKTKRAEYKRKNDLYFTLNNNDIAVELPSNKKDLAKIFQNIQKTY